MTRPLLPAWLRQRIKKLLGCRASPPPPSAVRRADPRQTYCVLAWKHLQINPEGTAKLCCRASGSVHDGAGRYQSLDALPVEAVWNSRYMQDVRRKMVNGERLPECSLCYEAEDAGRASYRTESNEKWLGKEGRTLDEAIGAARANLGKPVPLPVFYQLNLGNLCNLKCRMCSSSYSSQIEADAVHNAWSPRINSNDSGLARWSGETLRLRPGQVIGLHKDSAAEVVWQGGDALSLPLRPPDVLTAVSFTVHPAHPRQRVRVLLNGETVHEGEVGAADWPASVDLRNRALNERLELCVQSDEGTPRLEEVVLRRTLSSARKAGFSNVVATRFDAPGDWHRQDSVLFGEILSRPEALEELYFTGGEPLINPKFREIITALVDGGAAERLTLQLNSNVTIVPDELLAQVARFKQVTFTLSLDAASHVYEYIRYPAKWPVVAENVRRIAALKNADITAVPVLTAYNLLYLTDLFRFLDALDIKFRIFNCAGPDWLMIHVFPQHVLQEAASRFYDYLKDCREENRLVVQSWADALAIGRVEFRPASFATFNEFTNDLDASRGQSFARTFPDLIDLLAGSGCPWSPTARRVELLQVGNLTRKAS
jgi:glutamate-1-semialdehyde 2,1-aminomutase